VRQLKLRGDVVSLFLVDQRMPRMTGVEFLAKGIKDFPRAKRVLLTAYADTEAAINAINEVQIDHYLTKPWDPPEERLNPGGGSFHFHRCNAAHRLRRRSD
jgi:thioredoxin reductase (NADPH)